MNPPGLSGIGVGNMRLNLRCFLGLQASLEKALQIVCQEAAMAR
jgi:hypothetical protein